MKIFSFITNFIPSQYLLIAKIAVAAILSWVYNLGISNYKLSTFKKKIDIKDWVSASNECKKWDKAKVNGVLTSLKGLTLRREKEARVIFIGG